MILYAESSALLSWLFGEAGGDSVAEALERCEDVFSSSLTLVECDRALLRARITKRITRYREASLKRTLVTATSRWEILAMDDRVVERARRPFQYEPIRTLDAIHLSSALIIRNAIPELEMLTLDDRVRSAAIQSGIPCRP